MNKEFVLHRRVRFGDCDPGGILYTPRIAYFIVEAALDFVADRFGAPAEKSIFELGVMPPARALSVEFIKPIAWDDELEIKVSVKEIRSSAVVYTIVGYVSGDLAFASELTQVCVDIKTKQPVSVPAKLREILSDYIKD